MAYPAASTDRSEPAQPSAQTTGREPARQAVLSADEAARRLLLLAELQNALAARGMRCVLARTHRLVLRWNSPNPGPYRPSGPTDPQLHIFTPAGSAVATTDGAAYHLAAGQQCPADDPARAAALISSIHPADLRSSHS